MYIHAHTCARTPARAHTPAHPHARTRTRMHPHPHAHACTRAPMHACTCTHARTCTPACLRTCTPTHAHARMPAHLHAHALASCTHATCERVGMRDVSKAPTIAIERIRTACSPFLACSPYRCGSTRRKRLVGAVIHCDQFRVRK